MTISVSSTQIWNQVSANSHLFLFVFIVFLKVGFKIFRKSQWNQLELVTIAGKILDVRIG